MSTKQLGIWIFLATLFIYFLSYSGIQHSIDEAATMAATDSFMRGLLQVNRMEWEQQRTPPQNAFGTDGNLYSKKGPGVSLLVLPFFVAGKYWTAVGAMQLSFLVMGFVTAVTVLLFFYLAIITGYTKVVAAIGAVILGAGTPLWPYARWLFSEPLAALGVCLTLLGLVVWRQHPSRMRGLVWSAVGMVITVSARSANAVLVVPVGLLVLGALLHQFRRQRDAAGLIRGLLAFGLPLLTAVLLMMGYNYVRFRTLFFYPLYPGETFSTPLAVGLAGLLWSPGKGLLFYAPVTWLIGLGFFVAPRQMLRLENVAALSLLGVTLLLYGRWYDWAGGLAWGPRFLVTVLPAIVLASLPALAWLSQPGRGRRLILAFVIIISILAQLPGVLVNFGYQAILDGKAGVTLSQSIWRWPYSPLLSYWDNVFSGSADPIWLHAFFWDNPRWLLAGLLLLVAVISGLLLLILVRFVRQPNRPVGAGVLPGLIGLTAVFGLGMVIAARPDPRWLETSTSQATTQAVRDWITARSRPNDLILLDLRDGFDNDNRIGEWVNFASAQPDYIGWNRKTDLEEVEQSHLRQWLGPYSRVWLSLQATPLFDPNSTTEGWLHTWAYPGQEQWFDDQRVVEFVLPGPMETAVAEGGPAPLENGYALESYAVHSGKCPQCLLIDLVWTEQAPEDLRFSLQVWDAPYEVRQQVDRRPQTAVSTVGYHDRVGLVVEATDYTLILKLYNAATGQVYPFLFPAPTTPDQDALILLSSPGS
ncbi:MAG: hypothetical protein KC441_12360 [Anaerolineales bacterium]|nr:hypothetical protein [Anaerolineales bacterium]